VVAAGNSQPGVLPATPYPDHWQDPAWGVGHWAVGFNSLKCGSFVGEWNIIGGIADVPNAPSPFCKVGPGLANAPVPDFSAHGGNLAPNFRPAPGLGVWGVSSMGFWEDKSGTSFAAPILARDCAMALQALQPVCPSGSHPFGVTVKAMLAVTAEPISLPQRFKEAAERTLGRGKASPTALFAADAASALFVWQGMLNHKGDIARVVVVIPKVWLEEAGDPVCDASVAWDTPVNAAFPNAYGCRRVDFRLKPNPDADAVRGSRGAHSTYPLRIRTYGLKKALEEGEVVDDLWTVELSYDEVCDYPPTQTFTPEQRVSFSLRLHDRAGLVSPQAAVQASSAAATMTRLSAAPIPIQAPVMVKNPA